MEEGAKWRQRPSISTGSNKYLRVSLTERKGGTTIERQIIVQKQFYFNFLGICRKITMQFRHGEFHMPDKHLFYWTGI
jgi:hypothetical protein